MSATAPLLRGTVVLRSLGADDAPDIVAYASSPGFFHFVPDVPERLRHTYNEQDAQGFLREAREAWRAGWPTWGIEHGGHLVGTIRIAPVAWHEAGAVGYGLHPGARGRGVATEALRMVLAWCRAEGRQPPAARCDPEHEASQRVLRGCGFEHVGHGLRRAKP